MLPDYLDSRSVSGFLQWLRSDGLTEPAHPGLLDATTDGVVPCADLLRELRRQAGWQCDWISHPEHSERPFCHAFTLDGRVVRLTRTGTPNLWCLTPATEDDPNSAPAQSGTFDELRRTGNLALPLLALHPVAEPAQPVFAEPSTPPEQDLVWPVFLDQWRLCLGILGAAVLLAMLAVVTPLGFQTFADRILPNQASQSLMVLTVFMLAGAVASSLIQCFRDYQEHVLSGRFQVQLGEVMLTRLLAMNQTFFDARPVGDLTKLMEQIDEAAGFLVRQLLTAAMSVLTLAVILPLLFSYSATLAGIVLAISLGMALTVGLGLPALQSRVRRAYRSDARYQSVLIEMLKGMTTIRAMTNETQFRQRTHSALVGTLVDHFRVDRFNTWLSAGVQLQSQTITIAVIFFGAQAVFAQTLSIGQLIAFNMLANHVVQPLISLVMTGQGWASFRLARQKINELQPDAVSTPETEPPPDLSGDIDIDRVSFQYPGSEQTVLKDLSLRIRGGETLGLVGPSGSGKSTLTQLLLGLYDPTQGEIRIGGRNIRHGSKQALRRRIALVPQHCFLFSASLRDNVRLGRLEASAQDISEALEQSGCREFVNRLPGREDAILQEDADNLSGGQRQRLAIARALVRDSDIILFDEATSALDLETEARIRAAMRRASRGRTALIIAHRLSTLGDCDRIAVMDQGRIIAVGCHQHLLATCEHYQRLWALNHSQPSAPTAEGNGVPA